MNLEIMLLLLVLEMRLELLEELMMQILVLLVVDRAVGCSAFAGPPCACAAFAGIPFAVWAGRACACSNAGNYVSGNARSK